MVVSSAGIELFVDMTVNLYPHQLEALKNIHNGCILCGGVGSGKSLTSLAYYYLINGGDFNYLTGGDYEPMDDICIKDLYIITTARKRDTNEWDKELLPFMLTTDNETKLYKHTVVIDSWNNIGKYTNVQNAFFIFDEQRVVGYGAWTKSFLKITKNNEWILLSATPGDTWMDYIPVFIANGFYRNKTDFVSQHVIWKARSKFPSVDRYINTGRLIRLRQRILVQMDFERHTITHDEVVMCDYDILTYKHVIKDHKNPFVSDLGGREKPIENAAEFCCCLRKVVNTDPSRLSKTIDICRKNKRVIVFYNYDYELEELRSADYGSKFKIAEWNGHKHQDIPNSDYWVYLVQYNAGAEGWNCTVSNTILFYSQTYSYKTLIQSKGRIDRLNTPYTDLYYYHLKSRAPIDIAISRALTNKKKFNETAFVRNI